jgi:phenylacetate-CoA ligase
MFVRPEQVRAALGGLAGIGRARLVVSEEGGRDAIHLLCEVAGEPDGLAQALAERVRAATGLRAEVALVPPGSLPNDGRVIEDRRAAS